MRRSILSGGVLALLLAGPVLAQGTAQEIKGGGIFALTGITSDVGKSYAQGVRDAGRWATATAGGPGAPRALKASPNRAKCPYVPPSFPPHRPNPAKTPYNFLSDRRTPT